ncbi:MAG: NAD(P)/FAD-dependent oxidoreductase [Anaerolineae bacterium]|nr:NAD(P)/FAD-dependent oxidoreductase [Anaerolineae bacterium]
MRYVIVGGGVAGMTAALDLSRHDDAEIHLYTDEGHPYYYRPQVTNFLAGVIPFEKIFLRSGDWYEERGIYVHLNSLVVDVDPEAKQIVLKDGARVGYDRLLLAPGSCPFVPPIAGADKQGVFTIRTLQDALDIKAWACECKKAVVVGGGLLGLEAARALKGMGLDVTIVEFKPWLMPVQLDQEGAAVLQAFVEAQGYHVILNDSAKTIAGDDAVSGVVLGSGKSLDARMVVIAAGVRPNVTLAEKIGLEVNRGIIVDAQMRAGAPDVYAAGDAVRFQGICWAIVPTAQAQARIAAANMAGDTATYENIAPSTALKVVGVEVSSMGAVHPSDDENYDEVRVVDAEGTTYKKIVLHHGVIVGAIVIGDRLLAKELGKRIEERAAMTREAAEALLAA